MNLLKTQYLEWAGNFFGGGLDFEHYEILMIQYVPKKDRKIETQLMTTKWFDYRLMHPMMATYYFYKLYKVAYQNFFRKAIDHEAAEFVRPIKVNPKTHQEDFLLSREAMTFWRLRQAVDALGMRYDFFLNYAFEHCFRVLAGGKVMAPRPAHLKSEDMLANAYIAWEAICDSTLQIACSPYFTASHYVHSSMQQDYEDFIVKQIQRRRVPYYSLSACLYLYDAIRIEKALFVFDEFVIQNAIEHAI